MSFNGHHQIQVLLFSIQSHHINQQSQARIFSQPFRIWLKQIFNKKFGKRVEDVSSEVRNFFMRYNWPGNVRELKNTLEHAFILCSRNVITIDELPPEFVTGCKAVSTSFHNAGKPKVQNIRQALVTSNGNKSQAARVLGISRRTLYRKIHEYKITSWKTQFNGVCHATACAGHACAMSHFIE